jgi:cell division protein FtsZ
MKLYEVDEAATRIREEVDQEANIIVGATFDESLDGVIRVSVVATGIDKPAVSRDELNTTEARIAEVAERLKAEARQRLATAAARVQAAQPLAVAHAEIAPAPAAIYGDGIRLEPVAPRAVSIPERAPEPAPAVVLEDSYIPPAPERAIVRPVRMPRVDELPQPAQELIAAKTSAATGAAQGPAASAQAEARHGSIMQKLASFGFGRKDEHAETPSAVRQEQPAPAPRAVQPAPSAAHAEYMRRPAPEPRAAQGQLDQHGRQPAARSFDDDQLEIPAFLRRKAN